MNIIDKILNSINNLPTLTTIYNQLSEAIDDEYASNQRISQLISSDQATSLKILKVANSPLFGIQGKIESINQALLFLGHTEVKNILSTLSIVKQFNTRGDSHGLRPVDLWAHSIGVGIISRNLALISGHKKVDNYFLAGILHDIGKLIFLEFVSKEYMFAVEFAENENIPIKDAEKEILKIDHTQAGQLLAEKWKMPQYIQDVIQYHHSAQTPKGSSHLLSTVHISNIMARIMRLGFSGDNLVPQPNMMVWDEVEIEKGDLISLQEKIVNDFKNAVHTLLVD
ncbi:MAG: HDOD domain-containing protein [Melioribacteraceae bacterium]|nr:HDOD domain-containing protein [Melioribacteraceae bacterium]